MHVGPDVASRGRANREFRFGKLFYFLFLLYSPMRGENLRNLHTLEIPTFISFYFILFYFTLFFFHFLSFLCLLYDEGREIRRADTIPCCYHADVLRLPSSSASVDSVAASPMSPRGYLLRDGGCWSAATPSSFFFFFFWSLNERLRGGPLPLRLGCVAVFLIARSRRSAAQSRRPSIDLAVHETGIRVPVHQGVDL